MNQELLPCCKFTKKQLFTIPTRILSMMICIQNLVSFCQFALKILSKNRIPKSIKGSNSVANLRKTMIYITGLFVFKILSKNSILTSIKGRNSVANCRNSNSSKLSCISSLPARMKKIKLKMKVQDCSQGFSHYKSMGIFPDAQGQLTPQSLVESG